jgi:uncharacterized protein YecT (DUF1311 family)
MRMRLLFIPFIIVSILSGQQKSKRDDFVECDKTAKTQADLNQCAIHDDTSANEEMNQTYQELLRRDAANAIAVKKIEASQAAWIAFREAQIDALYPAEDKMEYGSAFAMCVNLLRADLTHERTKMLKDMLKRPVEGDVCGTGYPESPR